MEYITTTSIILNVIGTFIMNYKNIRLPHSKFNFR
jgi:hypothetical protein